MLLGKLRISGHSMEPTIEDTGLILISSIFYLFKDPQINDIVAFRHNKKIFIKRITKLKNKKYFLEGDNKNDSFDSRHYGWILKKDILGKAIYRFK